RPRRAMAKKRDEGVAPPAKARAGGAGQKFVEPMKALLVDAPPAGEWIYEIKFDGFRALAFCEGERTRLVSRNNKDFSAKFPEVCEAVAALGARDAVIDGEIVALDEKGRSSFQLLQAFELGEERPPIYFYVFDLLRRGGEDLMKCPLTERKAELERLVQEAPDTIRFSTSMSNDPEKLLAQAQRLGLEGLIGKKPESFYEAGRRSGAWIKLKLHREQEFVIGGYTPPGGAREHFGALLVGYYEAAPYDRPILKFAGKVGTGFDARRLRDLHDRLRKIATETCPFADLPEKRGARYGTSITAAEMRRCHWVKPVLVGQIRFAEWTRDGRLRQPVFLGLREDKPAREVVRERET
ncbi:MAG TPA: non-homologous end-joining DNA ligase, partial [Opitutus sp.]|nr:non-homologous end-joining DNA ligase [Opitutus sp.]